MFKYSFFSTACGLLPVHYNKTRILCISFSCGSKHFHVAMNSKLNQAYLLPPSNGLTLMNAEMSKTMNETMI